MWSKDVAALILNLGPFILRVKYVCASMCVKKETIHKMCIEPLVYDKDKKFDKGTNGHNCKRTAPKKGRENKSPSMLNFFCFLQMFLVTLILIFAG